MRYPNLALARLAAFALATLVAVGVFPPRGLADEATSTFTLDNGMKVVVLPDHRAPIVDHSLWYKVGAADEEPGKSGIAHFFEHLMFKGTSTYGEGVFSEAVTAVGGSQNAATSQDYTFYYQKVPPAELEDMMRFEADRMRNLVLSDEHIETERQVVLEERNLRTDNNPQAILREEIGATLYQNHPYGVPVIGWKREIENLTRADLLSFYERYYQPNNAVLVVTGDVEAENVRALAEKTYGRIPRGPELGPRERPAEPDQKTRRSVTLRDPRVSVPSYSLNWFVPSGHNAEAGEVEALAVLTRVLGDGTRSRLYQELVVRQGIASGVGAYLQTPAYDYADLIVYGQPRGEAGIAEVEQAIKAQIAKIAEEGITADELDAARARIKRDWVFSRDSLDEKAITYGTALATGHTVEDVETMIERLGAVTLEDVRRVARRYLNVDKAVEGYLLPQDEEERT